MRAEARREAYRNDPTARRERNAAWRARNRPQVLRAKKSRHLKKKYGLTVEQRNAMISEQKHCCKICSRKRKLVVDHCHSTGKVRGMLCDPCNIAIGYLDDNVRLLDAARTYLAASRS